MHRRSFLTLLGGASAAAWPLAARGQQPMPVVGYLNIRAPGEDPHLLNAFKEGLHEKGFVEGRNLAIEYKWAGGHIDRYPVLAADLVLRKVAVIAALSGSSSALAAKAATATTPIVFAMADNPVELGLVASLNRPGGNLTGFTTLGLDLGPKRLELLHELVPPTSTIALLHNSTGATRETYLNNQQQAAGILGRQLRVLQANTDREIDAAFAELAQLRAGALVIGNSSFFSSRVGHLAALALRHALPSVYIREFAAAGGLFGYGGSVAELYRLAGTYTGRILQGEKPAELPVQQATKIELVINMRTARALGVSLPITLLGRADAVIE